MTPTISGEDAGDLGDLWARLERLKKGIGGLVVQLVTAEYGSAEFEDADRQARRLVVDAIEVRDQIRALAGPGEGAPYMADTPSGGVAVGRIQAPPGGQVPMVRGRRGTLLPGVPPQAGREAAGAVGHGRRRRSA